MKILIEYYSRTGNNAALAERIAEDLRSMGATEGGSAHGVTLFPLAERVPRKMGGLVADMVFGRKPALQSLPDNVGDYDLVVFLGPVWMFHIAAPLRTAIKAARGRMKRYCWVSVSGGALGPNPGIAKELVKRAGKGLALCLDLNIAQYCEVPAGPSTGDTGEYRLAEHPGDLERLAGIAASAVGKLRP